MLANLSTCLLSTLQQRYTELRTGERRAQWRAAYAEVKAKRDATAEKLQAINALTEQLIEVLQEAKEVDQEVARINSTAPNGEHDRLLDTECAARGVNAVGPNSVLSLLTEMKLPRFSAPGWAWPPPAPVPTAEMVVPAAMYSHPMDRWHEGQAERKAASDAEAKRVSEFYRRQQRESEDKANASARAERARRQGAST